LRFSPNDAVIRQNLQNAEQSLKNAEAQELARQQQVVAYQQLQAEANSLNEKGSAASREGKWAEAINYYQEALKLTPDSVVIRQSLLDAEHNLKNAHAKESAPQKPIAPGKEAAPKGDFAKDNHELVNSLKGRGPANPQQLALKKSNPTIILPGWNPEELSNPQIYRIAKNLDSIKAPPPPLPAEKVTLEWSQLAAENSGVILKVVDSALLVWDIGWHVSKKASFLCTAILIGGKTVLAGEEGAFIFLTKKNEVYESALKYLKNPETAKRFVELHKEFKATGNVASKADQDMITAVKAISDPSLGSSGMKLAWDAMLSPEARVAMIQKACIEIGSALFVQGSMTHSADLARRKEIFDSIRLERNKAVSMLKTATDQVQQFELNRVITHANKRLSQLYHVYGAGPKLMGFIAGNYLCDEAEKTLKEK
jgi:tetratricopeptide (TPR) repeat protein